MKLALVRQRYNPYGGAERFVERAVSALADLGVSVTVVARDWTAAPSADMTLLRCNPFYFGRRWRDLQAGVPADDEGRVTTFIREYPRHLEVAVLIIAAIVLIALPSLSATAWIVSLVVVVVWFLFVEYTRTAAWLVSFARRLRRKDEASA